MCVCELLLFGSKMANKLISIGRTINYWSLEWSDGAGTRGAAAAFSASTASTRSAIGESSSGAAPK